MRLDADLVVEAGDGNEAKTGAAAAAEKAAAAALGSDGKKKQVCYPTRVPICLQLPFSPAWCDMMWCDVGWYGKVLQSKQYVLGHDAESCGIAEKKARAVKVAGCGMELCRAKPRVLLCVHELTKWHEMARFGLVRCVIALLCCILRRSTGR